MSSFLCKSHPLRSPDVPVLFLVKSEKFFDLIMQKEVLNTDIPYNSTSFCNYNCRGAAHCSKHVPTLIMP